MQKKEDDGWVLRPPTGEWPTRPTSAGPMGLCWPPRVLQALGPAQRSAAACRRWSPGWVVGGPCPVPAGGTARTGQVATRPPAGLLAGEAGAGGSGPG
jgi:hypothetical protein